MTRPESGSAQEKIIQFENNIGRALDILGKTGEDPLTVFPDPSDEERRMDVQWRIDMTEGLEQGFRDNAAELGFGREENIGPADLDVKDGYIAVLEGGLPHKMSAELALVGIDDETTPTPSKIIFAVNHERELKDTEQQLAKNQLGLEDDSLPSTEYDLAIAILQQQEKFDPISDESYPPVPVDHGDYTMVTAGTLSGVPVQLLGTFKSRGRVNNQTKIEIAAASSSAQEVVMFTSSTYQPTNELQALKAEENTGRTTYVATYGIKELAKAKGEADVKPPELNQLGGEYYKLAKLLKREKK